MNNNIRSEIGRFFVELRRSLNTSPFQIAALIQTRAEIIAALEVGDVEALPDLQETARIVMAYAALARVDGGPVVDVIAEEVRNMPPVEIQAAVATGHHDHGPAAAVRRRVVSAHKSATPVRRAGAALASGARRIPKDAIDQVRQRPDRAFYAATLPLGLLWLALNSWSVPQAPAPIRHFATAVSDFMSVQFAPVREGLRWIDVHDPRQRRADKLPPDGR